MVETGIGAIAHELADRTIVEVIGVQQRILAGPVGRRELVHQPALGGVDAAGRQDRIRELDALPLVDADAGDIEGIEHGDGNILSGYGGEGVREIAAPLGRGGNGAQIIEGVVEAQAFVADEEEGLVGAVVELGNPDGSAEGAGEIFHFERGASNALGIVAEAVGIQRFVAQTILAGAVKPIGAAFTGEDHRALRAAVLGAHVVDVRFHFLNPFRVREDGDFVPRRRLNRDAVHLDVAGEGIAAIHGEVREGAAGVGTDAEAQRRL